MAFDIQMAGTDSLAGSTSGSNVASGSVWEITLAARAGRHRVVVTNVVFGRRESITARIAADRTAAWNATARNATGMRLVADRQVGGYPASMNRDVGSRSSCMLALAVLPVAVEQTRAETVFAFAGVDRAACATRALALSATQAQLAQLGWSVMPGDRAQAGIAATASPARRNGTDSCLARLFAAACIDDDPRRAACR